MEELNETNLKGTELKKKRHKRRILNLLYQYSILTGPEICKKLGVSLPTAISLLNDLLDVKIIEIRGTGESSGGRKPLLYGLASDSLYVVACEVERYKGKIVIFNSHNRPVSQVISFQTNIDDEHLVDKINDNSIKLIRESGIDENLVFGLGVNMPGLIDEIKGYNYTIKDSNYRNVKERLAKKISRYVYVNNDARMQAFGEYTFGAAKGYKNALIVSWSYGVGLGVIVDGKLYNGANGFAGEFSHIKIVEDGDLCICGKRGCLETVASANVVLDRAMAGVKGNKVSQLTELFKDNPTDMKIYDIVKAAKGGDEFSIQLFHDVGLALGKGLAIAIQLLNPDIIVLGGPVSMSNQFVLIPIQQALNKYCLERIAENTKIVISNEWEHTGLLGVAAVLYQKIFGDINF